jgi:hypothetical protein
VAYLESSNCTTQNRLSPSLHQPIVGASTRAVGCGFCPSAPNPFPQCSRFPLPSPRSGLLSWYCLWSFGTKPELTNIGQGAVAQNDQNEVAERQLSITPMRHAQRCRLKKDVTDWFRKRIRGQCMSRRQPKLEGQVPYYSVSARARPSMEGAIGVLANKVCSLNDRGPT